MNIQQLRQSLKVLWLNYYREHRDWLTRIGVWVTCEGKRRPSSSFILATLSVLEPKLTQLLPLIVDLSSNPDRIVIALGLNFNPDEELESLEQQRPVPTNGQVRMLTGRTSDVVEVSAKQTNLEEPQPVAVRSVPKKPAAPKQVRTPEPKQAQPSLEPIDPNSPFGNLPDPLMEPAETETPSPAIPPSTRFHPEDSSARPVMDTVELAAGELPQREISSTDETCEGVRGRSVVRSRKDSR